MINLGNIVVKKIDVMNIWRKRVTESVNELIHYEAVYRTAPATPGLLIILSTFVSDALFVLQEALMSQQRQVAGYNLAAHTSPSLSAYICNKARRARKELNFTFYNFALLYIYI